MAADGNEKAARGSAPAESLSDRRIWSGCNARSKSGSVSLRTRLTSSKSA